MKRRILSMILTLAMVLSMLSAAALPAWAADGDEVAPSADEEMPFDGEGTEDSPDQMADEVAPLADEEVPFDGGSGTAEAPYQISTAEQLKEFARRVNAGEYNLCAELTQGIDLSSVCGEDVGGKAVSWTPIGNSTTKFTGTFDGGGHEITGLYISIASNYQGLFGYVSGTVKNVKVYGSVKGEQYIGGVVGYNTGEVTGCTNGGTVTGTKYAGGVVGYVTSKGIVENCSNKGPVNGNASGATGGVVGYAYSGNSSAACTIKNCYNEGEVSGTSYVGGVVGRISTSSTLSNCYNVGTVTASGSNVGGVVGSGSATNCYYLDDNASDDNARSTEAFASGAVAWLLQNGQADQAWGQQIDSDPYPVLTGSPEKRVWQVIFKAETPSIDQTDYYNNGAIVDLPLVFLPEGTYWVDSVTGETITVGMPVEKDINATAGKRIPFGGDSGVIDANNGTEIKYPLTAVKTLTLNLDQYMAYEDESVAAAGKFTYKITDGNEKLGATLTSDGKTLTIPKGVPAGDFLLTITAHEKEPQIATLSINGYGTSDVELTVKVVIEKGTPKFSTTSRPSALKSTFDGNEHALVKGTTNVDNGKLWYSLGDPDDGYGPDIPTAAYPGTYTVYYMIKGDDNYEDVYYKENPLVAEIGIEAVTIDSDPGKATVVEYGSWVTFTVTSPEYPAGCLVEFELRNGKSLGQAVYRDGKYELSVQVLSTYGFKISTQTSSNNSTTNLIYFKVNGVASSGTTYVKTAKKEIKAAIPDHEKIYDGGTTISDALELILTDGVEDCDKNDVSATAKCQFNNADAGEDKTITLINSPGITLSGDSAGYYNLDKANIAAGTGTIKPRGITAPTQTFSYNGGNTFTVKDVETDISDKTVTIEYTTSSANPGEYRYGESGDWTYTAEVIGNGNFVVTDGNPVTIEGTGEASVFVSGDTVTYGDELTVSVGPLPSGRVVKLQVNGRPIDSAEFDFIDGKYELTVPVTSAYGFKSGANAEDQANTVTVTEGGGTDTYDTTVTVNQKALTATIGSHTSDSHTKTYDGGTGISTPLTLTLIGVEGDDDVSATAKCEFDSADAGEDKTITLANSSGITLSGANAGFYTLVKGDVTAGKGAIKPYGITAPAQTFTYDGSTKTFQVQNIATDVKKNNAVIKVTVEYTTSSTDVGVYSYSESAEPGKNTYTAKVIGNDNFVVTGGDPVSIILEAAVQITLSSSSVTYGDKDLTISADSLPAGYDVAFGVNGTYTDELKAAFVDGRYVAKVSVTSANGFKSGSSDTAKSNTVSVKVNGAVNNGTAKVTVNRKALTGTIESVTKDYNNSKSIADKKNVELNGVEENDDVYVDPVSCEFDSVDAGERSIKMTSSTITLNGEQKDYYTLKVADVTGKGTIKPREITVPASKLKFTYNGTNTFTAESVSTGVTNKSATVECTTSSADVGTYSYGGNEGNTYTAKVTNTDNFVVTGGEELTIGQLELPATNNTTNKTIITVVNPVYDETDHIDKIDLTVEVKLGSNMLTLEKDKDYTVTYRSGTSSNSTTNILTVVKEPRTSSSPYYVHITGTGNYTGTRYKSFNVEKRKITDDMVTLEKDTYDYTGGKIEPTVTVTDHNLPKGSKVLTKGTDYTVAYVKVGDASVTAILDPGTYTVTIKGKGDYYTGTVEKTVTVVAPESKEITEDMVTLAQNIFTYAGEDLIPLIQSGITVKDKDSLLSEVEHYTVAYTKDGQSVGEVKDAGEYTVTIKGTGDRYKGSISKTVTVQPAELTVSVGSVEDKVYDGNTDTAGTITLEGAKGSDSPAASGTFNFTDKNVGENKSVNVTEITLTGDWGKNYVLSTGELTGQSTTAKITQRVAELTWDYTGPFEYRAGQPHTVTAELTNKVSGDEVTLNYVDNQKTARGNYTARVDSFSGGDGGNYTVEGAATATLEWSIGAKSIAGAEVNVTSSHTYNGTDQAGDVVIKVTLDGNELSAATDYTVAFTKNGQTVTGVIDAGEYTVTVTGKGNYGEAASTTFTVDPRQITEATVTLDQETFPYTGSVITPVVTVTDVISGEPTALNSGTDYTVTYTKDGQRVDEVRDAGTYTVAIEGRGNYSGKVEKTVTVNPKSITDEMVTLAQETFAYTGGDLKSQIEIGITVKDNDRTLNKGEDYTVSYTRDGKPADEVRDAGTYTVTIAGTGNYTGTETRTVTVNPPEPTEITGNMVTLEQGPFIYTGGSIDLGITVTDGPTVLSPGTDYRVTYTRNGKPAAGVRDAGTYTVAITGDGNYKGTVTISVTVQPKEITGDMVTVPQNSLAYNGFARIPKVTVMNETATLEADTDYEVSYSNNINAGTASVTIKGIGNYTGTAAGSFTILKAPLTPNSVGTVEDKVYDGNTDTAGTVILTGAVNGEQPTASGTFNFTDKNVGENKSVNVTGIALDSEWETNYTLTTTELNDQRSTAKITPLAAKLSWDYTGPFEYRAGQSHTVTATLTNKVEGDTVTLIHEDNEGTEPGSYLAKVTKLEGTHAGNYTLNGAENTTLEWSIGAKPIEDAEVTVTGTYTYNGRAQTPTAAAVSVTLNGVTLDPETDYTVDYADNINAGTATVTVTGKGDYAGTATGSFTIGRAELTPDSVGAVADKEYDGETATTGSGTGTVTLIGAVNGEQPTASGIVTFTDKNAGENKRVDVTNITLDSEWTANYTLTATTLSNVVTSAKITPLAAKLSWDYTGPFEYRAGQSHTVTATLTNKVGVDKVELIYGGDTSGSNVGTYEATVTDFSGEDGINYTLTGATNVTLQWEITGGEALTGASVTVAAGTYTYSGSAQTPAVTVKLNNVPLTQGTDYTVDYTNNINAGTATVTITGKGNYIGTATGSFTIGKAPLMPSVGMVANKTYDGTANAFGTVALAGAKGSDKPTATGTFTFGDKNVGENKRVDVTGIKLGSQWEANYALIAAKLNNQPSEAKITPLAAELSWDYTEPFSYKGSTFTVTATLTNMVDGDDVTLTCEGNKQSAAGEYTAKVTGLEGQDSGSYTLEGATGAELKWKIDVQPNVFRLKTESAEKGTTVSSPRIVDAGGNHYTVTGETAFTVTGTGSLYLTTGTIESKNGAGIEVQSGGFLRVNQAGMTVIGTTYGLDISSGAAVKLTAGTFTGIKGAIRADDYSALLASGYAFFDENGTPIPLAEIAEKTTVVVGLCETHSYRRYTPDNGVPSHDVTCEYCGTTASTERCTFSFDENGQAECERCGHRIGIAIDVSDDGNISVTVVLDNGTMLAKDTDYWVNASAGIGAITVAVTGLTYSGTCEKTFITGTEQPAAPSVGISYADEKLVGTHAAMQYHTGDGNWRAASPDMSLASIGWLGEAMTVYFRYPAGNGNAESETQTLDIPARPEAPEVALKLTKTSASITVTGADAAPGMMKSARAISRNNTGYEFSLDSGSWAGGEFTGLAAGEEYTILVRTPSAGNTFASYGMEWPVITVDGNGATTLKPGETAVAVSEDGTIAITNDGRSVAVKDGYGNTAAIVTPLDASDGVDVNLSGSVTVPEGGKVQMGGSGPEMTLPQGGTVDKTGVTADEIEVGDTIVIPPEDNHTFTPNEDGSVNVPSGSKVKDANGSTTASSQGGTISSGGSYKDNSGDDHNTGDGEGDDNTGDGEGDDNTGDGENPGGGNPDDGGNTENPEQPGCDCTECGCAEGTCDNCGNCACDQCSGDGGSTGDGENPGGENPGDGGNTENPEQSGCDCTECGCAEGTCDNCGNCACDQCTGDGGSTDNGNNPGNDNTGSSTGGNSSAGGGSTGGSSSAGGGSTGGSSSAGGGSSTGGSSSAGGGSSSGNIGGFTGGGSYGGGGGSSSTDSVVTGNPGAGSGAIVTNVSSAKKGDTVTVSAKADNGYISGAPTVTDKDGSPVTVIKNADGTYSFTMPEGGVTVTGSFLTPGQMFSDLNDNAWYRESIAYVVENGLMIGEGGSSFNPGGTTTRGMIMTILARQLGVDTTSNDGESWYQKGMDWAKQAGVSDGTNPEGSISREQLATMLWRFAGEPEVTGELSTYSDAGDIHADWAGSAMIWSVQAGIIQGYDGKLNPRGNAIRTEAAAMLARFCQFIEK